MIRSRDTAAAPTLTLPRVAGEGIRKRTRSSLRGSPEQGTRKRISRSLPRSPGEGRVGAAA
jgi:hypothetical protein